MPAPAALPRFMPTFIPAAFVAPPGHVILSADYSQIELRVLAHLSHDPELIDAFASGADVHARTAALIFGKAQGEVAPDERREVGSRIGE